MNSNETPMNQPLNQDENIKMVAAKLKSSLIKDFIQKTEIYDKQITELFQSLTETQELLSLSIDEQKKATFSLSKIEIDARISKALEEFEFDDKTSKKANNSSNWSVYILIAIGILVAAYFLNFK